MDLKKCLIIDDDPLICDLLKHFCSKQDWIGSTLSVGDGVQALQALDLEQFDLIFLDYNLPDLKGKNILNLMPEKKPTIMVTTEEAFAAESYEFDQIIDFLVKPVSYDRFLKAVMRYKKVADQSYKSVVSPTTSEKTRQNLMVKDGNTTVILKLDEIRYLKSESNYVVFYLNNRKVMSLQSLKKLEDELPDNFVRIQKSYMINLNYLESIKVDFVLVSGVEIPIGAVHKEQLTERLQNWRSI